MFLNFVFCTTFFTLVITNTYGQWISKKVDNGFDDPLHFAFVQSTEDDNYLKLENYDDGFDKGVVLFLGGEYYCSEESVFIELSFQVNGVNKKYSRSCLIQNSETPIAVISTDLLKEDFLKDFKACTTMKIRITDYECESNSQVIYSYKMSGSTAALTFVSKPSN